jgi:hypothetical protein
MKTVASIPILVVEAHEQESQNVGTYNWQRLIAGFLCKEWAKVSDIHRRISAVFGEKTPARSTVFRWVRSFDSGKLTAQDAVSVRYSNTPKACFREAI